MVVSTLLSSLPSYLIDRLGGPPRECRHGKENERDLIPYNFTKPEDILSGRKTATGRATAYGAKPGYTFSAGTMGRFRIIAVYREQLDDMTEEDAKKGGCDSLKDLLFPNLISGPFSSLTASLDH